MKNISPAIVASSLEELYWSEFAGKQNGRYKLSKVDLKALAGRVKIEQGIIEDIIEETEELGFLFFRINDSYFGMIEAKKCDAWRTPSSKVIKDFAKQNQENQIASKEDLSQE
jgi:hypothetical protein